jgi:phosphoribosylamine--glycine ligase
MPTLAGMAAEGMPYRGILYVGLMLTPEGPKVVEYNVRMGDPETQPVLFRMQSDLVEVCEAIQEQRLDQIHLEWDPQCSLCIVLASGGYPGRYQSGKIISGIDDAESLADVKVFHAGTSLDGAQLASAGGRVLGVTARGPSIKAARDLAYQAVQKIHFENMHYRHDIGARGLRRQDC